MQELRDKTTDALVQLGYFLQDIVNDEIQSMIEQAYMENPWFTPAFVQTSLEAFREEFLNEEKLSKWLDQYPITSATKNIGLILAGNIPAVGWHDVMCTIISGHRAIIKYSDKDKVIIPFLLQKLSTIAPSISKQWTSIDRLKEFDAVIATGSDNTSRYFKQYFGHKPHIIRKNRNAVAILDGTETADDFVKLGKDIFTFFGLGCRNVSKIYVPKDYDFSPFLETIHNNFKDMANHHKYRNNFDYGIALYLLNKVKYQNNGCLTIVEDTRFSSRIASLHYEYYDDILTLEEHLKQQNDYIQCIVSKVKLSIPTFPFGYAQSPGLNDYADGVDIMSFLGTV
jgi:hypothetical protein